MPRELRGMSHSPLFGSHSLQGKPSDVQGMLLWKASCTFKSPSGRAEAAWHPFQEGLDRSFPSRYIMQIADCLSRGPVQRPQGLYGPRGSAVAQGVEPAARGSGQTAGVL